MELKNIADIEALALLMEAQSLTTLELQHGEDKLVITRGAAPVAAPVTVAPAVVPPVPDVVPAPATNNENVLKSPLVGNVYLTPEPGKAPFVQAGDSVKKGQTLCIVEAMKVMNELPAPRDGTIQEIHVSNEQLVEFGQPLFTMQ